MYTKVTFELKGFEELLEQVQKAGGNIEEAVTEAIQESGKPVLEDIRKWAKKHKRSGAALEGVDQGPPRNDGGLIYADIGVNSDISPGAWHIAFVEYGTPTVKADPGVHEAFRKNKNKIRKIQAEVLRKAGIPID